MLPHDDEMFQQFLDELFGRGDGLPVVKVTADDIIPPEINALRVPGDLTITCRYRCRKKPSRNSGWWRVVKSVDGICWRQVRRALRRAEKARREALKREHHGTAGSSPEAQRDVTKP